MALERTVAAPTGAELIVDATELRFIDHRGLVVIDNWAARRGTRLVLLGANMFAGYAESAGAPIRMVGELPWCATTMAGMGG